jgi:hypothetical protein
VVIKPAIENFFMPPEQGLAGEQPLSSAYPGDGDR